MPLTQIINLKDLRAIYPLAPDNLPEFIAPLNKHLEAWAINTPRRMAAFLGQCAIESKQFRSLREDMYYKHRDENKIPRLFKVFRSKFTSIEEALQYEEKSEATANKVYANQLGNRDEASGDGFRYRAGGVIGLTFAKQYKLCGESIGIDLYNHPERIKEPDVAVASGCWYFAYRGLNLLADAARYEEITSRVNPAQLDMKQRIAITLDALRVWGAK